MNAKLQSTLYLLIQEMLEATDEERLEVMREIKGEFCDGCGTRESYDARIHGGQKCQCQNDE